MRYYMRHTLTLALLGLAPSVALGQITMDQKIMDLQDVAGLYAKNYGPYEWKRDALGYDLLNLVPWLDKVRATKNDLDFYDVLSEYVASLNDAHDVIQLPTNFVARLNFGVDVFDGKLLVDSITRARLPVAEFPFLVGYELVSIDGEDASKINDRLLRYNIAANPRSTRRLSAQFITLRPQSVIPHAPDVPEISTVVFRRPDGALEPYRIPWTRSGLPLTSVGKYPALSARQDDVIPGGEPDYMQPLMQLWNCQLPDKAVVGFGALAPVFAPSMPSGFTQRLGGAATDPFYSGVFQAAEFKIGFIRIPSFAPASATAALAAFRQEIAFFQAETDGLVIDEMRNPGGSVSYLNSILSQLIPNRWRSIPFEVRATSSWVAAISSALESAKATGAPQEILDQLQVILDALVAANRAKRGRTEPIPLGGATIELDPAKDAKGDVIAYTKPLMVLIDELSASGGDAFAATIQDNLRGPLFGWRTMGAGGNVVGTGAGSFSLASMTLTQSLMVRKDLIVTEEYPAAPYVENIGVRPDIQADYMTRDNLMQNGRPFVDSFVDAMVNHIRKSR